MKSNNNIRMGKVSAFHPDKGTADVIFPGSSVAVELTMMSADYRPMDPGEMVLCAFTDDGEGRGACLGRMRSDVTLPDNPGEQFTRINLRNGYIEHNSDDDTITIAGSATILLKGEVEVREGKLTVYDGDIIVEGGNVTVQGGDVVADGVSLKGHNH